MKPRYYALTALYCAGIFWLSSQSLTTLPRLPAPGIDKLAHAVLYGGLALVISLGLRRSGRPVSKTMQCWGPVFFCLAYGLSDETHQLFVPNRTFDFFDLAADVAGALLAQGWLCGWLWQLWPLDGGTRGAPKV